MLTLNDRSLPEKESIAIKKLIIVDTMKFEL